MTEEDARAWLEERNVPRETWAALGRYVELLRQEAARQNLVAASTLDTIWSRHIVDSAQLIDLAPAPGSWLDLGSGAGFPGLIVAALAQRRVTLVEARTKRVAFLHAAAAAMEISPLVDVIATRLEAMVPRAYAIISARAFAPLPRLLALAAPFATDDTLWLLPKGRGAARELAEAAASWQGDFRIVASVTDPESAIIVARQVRPRKRR